MFLFYTRVNVLFLPCKRVGPLIVNRNIKTRNQERSFFKYRNTQQNLKSLKKNKDLEKNSQKRKSSAKVNWKQALKSGEV